MIDEETYHALEKRAEGTGRTLSSAMAWILRFALLGKGDRDA